MNYQKDQNTVPLKEVNFEISALLENYIKKSREGKTSVLIKEILKALQKHFKQSTILEMVLKQLLN